ncbi:MAG: hypothetical protein Q7R69_03145 [bacterium]|nr:hypothetical protein [bacterium]
MNESEPRSQLDLLKDLEKLTEEVNNMAGKKGQSVFKRYPLTFALLALFGAVAVSEGVKGIIRSVLIFENNPWYLFLIGLVILIFTGTLYKKLDK